MYDKPPVLAVELHPHSPGWAAMAADETARLRSALDDTLVTVHHIGSTAIPGIRAKPVVDLVPLVTSLSALDAKEEAVRALGYLWCGEYGLARRRYCVRSDPASGKRLFQLHCYADGDPQIARHLAFRDYLRFHPAVAKAYEAEKIRAASIARHDANAYNAEKNDWIQRVEKEALAWRALNPGRPEP